METEHFDCQCSDFNHTIRFTFDPDDGDVYLDVRLNAYEVWYKRVWHALKYVFRLEGGYGPKYGHYDCTLLRVEDYDRLRDLMKGSEIAKTGNLARARELRQKE